MSKRLPVGLYIDRNGRRIRMRASSIAIDFEGPNALVKFRELAPRYLEAATAPADAPLAAALRTFLGVGEVPDAG